MKKGKKYLALLLAAVVATGSLQTPAWAETKNESGVQKETGEEISVQMRMNLPQNLMLRRYRLKRQTGKCVRI